MRFLDLFGEVKDSRPYSAKPVGFSRLKVWVAAALIMFWPAAVQAQILAVKVARANFRAGPSTKQRILFSASKYYPVKVVGRSKGWYRVKDFENDVAWVLSRLLGQLRCVVVKVKEANIRQQPTTKARVIFTAANGAAFKVLKKSGDWLRVLHADGSKGWVHRNLTWGAP